MSLTLKIMIFTQWLSFYTYFLYFYFLYFLALENESSSNFLITKLMYSYYNSNSTLNV